MKKLIVDVGNSSVKIALFEEDTPVEQWRLAHEALPELLAHQAKDTDLEAAIISSVVPLSGEMEQAVNSLPFSCLHMSARLKMPFATAYKTPDTLGPDRLAAVAGACAQAPGRNLLVIDIGSAITYDMLTAEGTYIGGNISPGIGMRFKALNLFTGRLPLVDKEGERMAIGNTTIAAIREGVLQGVDKEIEGYIEEYTQKYPDLLVFLTGGGTFLLDNRVKSRTFVDNLLVAKGLNHILRLNNEAI